MKFIRDKVLLPLLLVISFNVYSATKVELEARLTNLSNNYVLKCHKGPGAFGKETVWSSVDTGEELINYNRSSIISYNDTERGSVRAIQSIWAFCDIYPNFERVQDDDSYCSKQQEDGKDVEDEDKLKVTIDNINLMTIDSDDFKPEGSKDYAPGPIMGRVEIGFNPSLVESTKYVFYNVYPMTNTRSEYYEKDDEKSLYKVDCSKLKYFSAIKDKLVYFQPNEDEGKKKGNVDIDIQADKMDFGIEVEDLQSTARKKLLFKSKD